MICAKCHLYATMSKQPTCPLGNLALQLAVQSSETGSCTVKKGRHRRYEEARALKRGPDLDIEALLSDLNSDNGGRVAAPADDDIDDEDDYYDSYADYDDDYDEDDD